jgi:inorganic triphosphatase YgiF
VLAAHGYTISEHGASQHVDCYYDTQNWSIAAAGWACRLRHRDDANTLTLKSLHGADADSNVFVRAEINQRTKPQEITSPLHLPPGPVRDELDDLLEGMDAEELFRVCSRRTIYELEKKAPSPVRLELDLDETRIEADKRTEKASGRLAFTELELELKSGDAADVESAAGFLRDEAGLTPAQFSKFERGLQAAGVELDAILLTTESHTLTEDDPVLRLLYQYLEEQSKIVWRQHPRALEGIDPEGVHQMRVASRRLRALLKTFKEIFGNDVVARFNNELRWLARNLGRARDADVTEQGTRDAEHVAADHYEQYLGEETISAYEHLVEILQCERCAALEDEVARFVSAGPTAEMQERVGNLSIRDCAREYVGAALQTLLAHGDSIDAGSPAKRLHKLRLETKRFRYLLDFFSAVQPEKWAKTTEAVKQLQDVLGEHQDAVTAQARLSDYAALVPMDESGRDKLLATGRLMQKEDERIAATRQQFVATWSVFREMVA